MLRKLSAAAKVDSTTASDKDQLATDSGTFPDSLRRGITPLFRFPIGNRPLRIDTPLGADAFALLELRGHEGMSELFEFELRLATDRSTTVDFDKLLGKFVTVTLSNSELGQRIIHALVIDLVREQDVDVLSYYRATIAPQFWLFTQRKQSRIFQQQSVPDILTTVLTGLQTKVQLAGQYLPRDYCVQYDETDFDFAARLMEEEGIFYFFEHAADSHTLVLCDDVANLPAPTLLQTVMFDPDAGGTRHLPRTWQWHKQQRIVTSKFTCWDQCFELPTQNFEADTKINSDTKIGGSTHKLICREEDLESYTYPAQVAKWFDGIAPGGSDRSPDVQHIYTQKDRRVKLLAEASAASALASHCESSALCMLPGSKFQLINHGWGDGKYLALRVEHNAQMRVPTRTNNDPDAFVYENRVVALPDGLPYRKPFITQKPRIVGVQTAVVTGTSGQQAFVDKYGRIKVQFPWDRAGQKNAESSCWVRVAQSWAGPRYGAFFWPRIGNEVVVVFEDGDPDRPLVVGSVYNAANMPPLDMPTNVQLNGVKSCSFGSDPLQHFNAIIFHDIPGQEYVQVHSETHAVTNTKKDSFEYVPSTSFRFHGSM